MTDVDRLQELPEEQPSLPLHDQTTPVCTDIGRCQTRPGLFDQPNR